MRRTARLAAAALALACTAACEPGAAVLDTATQDTVNYLAAKRAFGDALGQAVATQQGPVYRMVAITGPQYPVGSALDPANPVDVVAPACVLPEPPLVPWAPLPALTQARSITLGAELPSLIQRSLPALAGMGVRVGAGTEARWRMEDIAQRLAPQTVFAQAIAAGPCRAETAGRDILFVRGIVYARETIASARTLGAGATAAAGTGLRVSADGSGGFLVEDSAPIPRFHIVTLKPAEEISPAASRRPVTLAAPTDAMLARMENP